MWRKDKKGREERNGKRNDSGHCSTSGDWHGVVGGCSYLEFSQVFLPLSVFLSLLSLLYLLFLSFSVSLVLPLFILTSYPSLCLLTSLWSFFVLLFLFLSLSVFRSLLPFSHSQIILSGLRPVCKWVKRRFPVKYPWLLCEIIIILLLETFCMLIFNFF